MSADEPGWHSPPPPPPTKQREFEVLTRSQLRARPRVRWIVEGWVPDGSLVLWFGAPSSGKTTTAVDLAMSIAGGLPDWQGFPIRRSGVVVYLCAEGEGSLEDRTEAWEQLRSPPPVAALDANLRAIRVPVNLESARELEALRISLKKAGAWPPVLVVIDTLNSHTPGAHVNEPGTMGLIAANLKDLCRNDDGTMSGTVLVLHHPGWPPAQRRGAGNGAAGVREMGSSVLRGQVDFAVKVTRGSGGRVTMERVKQRDSAYGDVLTLDLVVVPLPQGGPSVGVRRVEGSEPAGTPDTPGVDEGKIISFFETIISFLKTKTGDWVPRRDILKGTGIPVWACDKALRRLREVQPPRIEKGKRGQYRATRGPLEPPTLPLEASKSVGDLEGPPPVSDDPLSPIPKGLEVSVYSSN
ncbi:MAG: AAA family ATPase [Gemmatimonadetes bacterium]|nr:AAA family ATPase [Gemmatimonadota bacterium]